MLIPAQQIIIPMQQDNSQCQMKPWLAWLLCTPLNSGDSHHSAPPSVWPGRPFSNFTVDKSPIHVLSCSSMSISLNITAKMYMKRIQNHHKWNRLSTIHRKIPKTEMFCASINGNCHFVFVFSPQGIAGPRPGKFWLQLREVALATDRTSSSDTALLHGVYINNLNSLYVFTQLYE